MNEFWINFLANFFSDLLVGAGIGFFIARWLNKLQQKETATAEKAKLEEEREDRKKKILELIYKELETNRGILRSIPVRQDNRADFDECYAVAHQLKNELWMAFSDGGELQWINNVVLVDAMAQAYYSIRTVQYAGSSYTQSKYIAAPSFGPVISELIGKFLNDNIAAAKDHLNSALGLIETELPDLRKDK